MFPHRSRPSCTCSRSAAVATVCRAVRRELSAVVYGALPKASAAVSALERTRVHGVARGQLSARLTEAVTTGADTSACGRAGGGERSEPPGKRQRAASASERRREGYVRVLIGILPPRRQERRSCLTR